MDTWYNEGGALHPIDQLDVNKPGLWIVWANFEGVSVNVFSHLSKARMALMDKYPGPRFRLIFDSWASGLVEATILGQNIEHEDIELTYWIEFRILDVFNSV